MPEKTLAAVAVDKEQTQIQELPIPEIPDDAGLLKVEIVGVCGSDVANYEHLKSPRILGHHVVGWIEKLGPVAAKRWGLKEGDRVAMEEYMPCGQCDVCRQGNYKACPHTDPRLGGMRYGNTALSLEHGLWGGFSQYMYLHPNAVLHKMPEHVPAVEAALTLPLSNGFEWMCLIGGIGPGKTAVIQGPGQQGLACALAAKYAGAEHVIVTGRSSSARRLQLALELGADHTVNVQTENLAERVAEITDGRMADVVIDVTSGGSEPILSSIEAAMRGGIVLLSGYKYAPIPEFDTDKIIEKTLTMQGVRGHGYRSVKMAVDFIASGRFPLSKMNSHNFGLFDVDMALKTAGGKGAPSPLLVTVSPWLNGHRD